MYSLNELIVDDKITLDKESIGSNASYLLRVFFKLYEFRASLHQCELIPDMPSHCLGVAAKLSHFGALRDISVNGFIFDQPNTSSEPQRQVVLVFTDIDELPTDFSTLLPYSSDLEPGEDFPFFANVLFQEPFLLFSTQDYNQGDNNDNYFPPLPGQFLVPKSSIETGFFIRVSIRLETTLSIPNSSDTTVAVNLEDILTPLGCWQLLTQAIVGDLAISTGWIGNRVTFRHKLEGVQVQIGNQWLTLDQVAVHLEWSEGRMRWPTFTFFGKWRTRESSELAIQASLSVESKLLHLSFSDFPNISEFSALLGGGDNAFTDILKGGVPEEMLTAIGQLEVTELALVVDVSSGLDIVNISTSMGTEEAYSLTDDVTIDPMIKLEVAAPLNRENREVTFEILGSCDFPGATLYTNLMYVPGEQLTTFSAQLPIGTAVNTTDFLNKWLLDTGIHLPDMNICDLEFVCTKSDSSYAIDFEIDLSGLWMIEGTGLGIDGVSLELEASKDGRVKKWQIDSATATGSLLLGPFHLDITAAYDAVAQSWTFGGGNQPYNRVEMGEFMKAVTDILPLSANNSLIQSLNTIVIDHCYLQYQTRKSGVSAFQFALEAHTHWDWHALPLSNVLFTFTRDVNGISYSFESSCGEEHGESVTTAGKAIDTITTQYDISITSSLRSIQGHLKKIQVAFDADTQTYKVGVFASLSIYDLLESIGLLEKQGEHRGTEDSFIQFTQDQPDTGTNSKDAKVLVRVAGGIRLSDVSSLTGGIPLAFDAELDFIEIEYISTQSGLGNSPQVAFKFQFSVGEGETERTCLLEGIQEDVGHVKVLAATISALDDRPILLPLGSDFPIKTAMSNIYVIQMTKSNADPVTIFGTGFEVQGNLKLGGLPVIGQYFKASDLSFSGAKMTYSTQEVLGDDLKTINKVLEAFGVAPLNSPATSAEEPSLKAGFHLGGQLELGDTIIPLHSRLPGFDQEEGVSEEPNLQEVEAPQMATPVSQQRGPVSIQSVGLGFSEGKVNLHFTGSLRIGPMALHLIGFELKTPIDDFKPELSLDGLGIDLQKPPLDLSGLLVKQDDHTYSGKFGLGYQQYRLTGSGSFGNLPDGSLSMFLYAFLGAPLGGPPFFFVTGAAAGFGYNRDLALPAPDQVKTHPLIRPVLPDDQQYDYQYMQNKFPSVKGDFWGAVGVRATSFKMVDSFVLLAMKQTTELEVDVIGISKMQYPVQRDSSIPPLARVELGWVARFLPETGVLSVKGALQKGSYVYHPAAHLSGEFGMLAVMKEQESGLWKEAKAGEFIFSMGGYAPDFEAKPYYPQPDRLQLNWQINKDLSVKGQAYFALTPQTMMAGVDMQANFQVGGTFSLHVYFTAGAHFLIHWKPYHYQAKVYAQLNVDASVSKKVAFVTIHMSVHFDVGAELNIWGPEFSGHACVRVHFLISFNVEFSFGHASQSVAPISWQDFKQSFLPHEVERKTKTGDEEKSEGLEEKECFITGQISKGQVYTQTDIIKSRDCPVVNPKELGVMFQSAVPMKSVEGFKLQEYKLKNGVKGLQEVTPKSDFGIKPMACTSEDFSDSKLELVIKKDGPALSEKMISECFVIEPIYQNLPSALWQTVKESGEIPENDGNDLITDLLTGIMIHAKPASEGPHYEISSEGHDDVLEMPAFKRTIKSFNYATAFDHVA